jgi:putative FmdB family regulatory protein
MPTYTYQCENCGVSFDQYQKFSEAPLITCPECGEHALRKVYQPVGIVFKGKGFYATDNRSPSGQSSNADKEESAKTKTESKNETKPETKPAKSKAKED